MSASELQRATEGEGDESVMGDSTGEARRGLRGKRGSQRRGEGCNGQQLERRGQQERAQEITRKRGNAPTASFLFTSIYTGLYSGLLQHEPKKHVK